MVEKFSLKSPLNVQIETTENCNHKCFYCYNHWRKDDFSKKNMSLKDSEIIAEKIIKEINPFFVVLTGGEPLMNFDTTFNLMKKFSKANINYTLNSNIILLTEEKLDKIIEVKPKIDILTSLPSFLEETYTKITGKNTIKKFYENFERGIKKGAKIVPNMVTHKLNQDQV